MSRVVAFAALALLQMAADQAFAVSLEEVKHERHRSVEALPELARIGAAKDTIFILRGRLSKDQTNCAHRPAGPSGRKKALSWQPGQNRPAPRGCLRVQVFGVLPQIRQGGDG
jgi:hypothetical protein